MGQDGIREQERKGFIIALRIDDVKQFTSKLFAGTTFNRFLMREMTIVIYNTLTIDGYIKQGYCTEAKLEKNRIEDLSSWAVPKPFCFSLIKRKKLPRNFRIVFQIAPADVEAFLGRNGLAVPMKWITGLYVNTRYEEGQLTCMTGMSVNLFALDKSLDGEWDEMVRQLSRSAETAHVGE